MLRLNERKDRKISYLVVLVKKIPFGKVKALESENERLPDYGCMDGHIDDAETKNNYHLVYPKGSYMDILSPHMIGTGKGVKKPCMMTIVVSSDNDFFDIRGDACIMEFFRDATKFLTDRYGARNMVSAIVHMDEDRPHLHVNLLPYDKDGNPSDISTMNRDKLRKFQDEIYEAVGRRWHLERGDNETGIERRTREEYLFARQMYFFQQDVSDIIRLIEAKRMELKYVTEDVEGLEEQRRQLKTEIRDMTMCKEALIEEQNRLRDEILKDTDFHAGIDMACAEPDPSYSKNKSIRILKARNYNLGEQLEASQAVTQELLGHLKDTDEKLREAESYKAKAEIADRIKAMYPEEWKALCQRAANGRVRTGDRIMGSVKSA